MIQTVDQQTQGVSGMSKDGTERSATFIYLCEYCDHEVATTSIVGGPFEAPPSLYCPCSGELREMEPMRVEEGDTLAVPFAGGGS
jgi:hypothetical protein